VKNPILAFICLFLTIPCQAGIIYVDADANGANNGTSWADAYNYLQDALTDANSNGDVNEIWVAAGIYTPDSNSANPNGSGDRTATFQLLNDVAIYGGFPPGPDPNWKDRDPNIYETILSGDLDDNDVDVNDPCDLPTEPTRGENSYHVVIGGGTDQTAVLDGFTVTGGNANQGLWPDADCAGGGMYNEAGSPTVTNCTFTGNSALCEGGGAGGGMYNYDNSSPNVTNCTLSGNYAVWGGGIQNLNNSSPTLTNCTFSGNYGWWGGGGMNNSHNCSTTVTNCTFSGNYAGAGGGMINGYCSPTVTNCIFTGNTAADDGGGMYLTTSGSAMVTNCTFSSNEAISRDGGGMYNDGGVTLFNCILWSNIDRGGSDEGAQIHDQGTIFIEYSCVQGWTGALGGTGNIGDAPNFIDPNGPDNIVGTEDDNMRLSPDSNCIDAGDNAAVPIEVATDLDGHLRIIDGDCNDTEVIDMGAYEFNYAYMGDFDYNCEVNFGDFAILALAWLTEPPDENWNQFCDIGTPDDDYIYWGDIKVLAENWRAGP
jgi:parallel beta-helix repeat protein